ncbi:MAG: bifunctional glutamate N-acetyltransferase/amino-acid acetyltransferase ArgJ [Planctomycetota bacterium]
MDDSMWDESTGGVTAARGFRAGTARCGIKQAESDDLALLVCDADALTAAAVFTTNRVCAAPVHWSREALRGEDVRAAVVNSGNANACTGERGLRDAEAMATLAAEALGLAPRQVAVASTGIIGHYLPMDKLPPGIEAAAAALDDSPDAGLRFARAIMTTDTVAKHRALRCDLGDGAAVTLGGATKGAGMIAPGMATTLTFLTTDASVDRTALAGMLTRAIDASYNRISIDQHMSTNDTCLLLASGAADAPPVAAGSEPAQRFEAALGELCDGLARQIVADGEGATKRVRIEVAGAPDEATAVAVGRAIADSPLCKCAFHSGDPNWGRFVSAAGYACPALEEARARFWIGDVLAYARGAATDASPAALAAAMAGDEIHLRYDLGLGAAQATVWTCDLSADYIAINAEYHT